MQVRALMNYAYILKSEKKAASTRATYDEALALARAQVRGQAQQRWGQAQQAAACLRLGCIGACVHGEGHGMLARGALVGGEACRRSGVATCMGGSPAPHATQPQPLPTEAFSAALPPLQHGATHGMVEKIKYELTAFLGTTGREVRAAAWFWGRPGAMMPCLSCALGCRRSACCAGWPLAHSRHATCPHLSAHPPAAVLPLPPCCPLLSPRPRRRPRPLTC